MRPITISEMDRRFKYVAPDDDRRKRHEAVGAHTLELAVKLLTFCPNPSRELSLALTHLEQVRMYANMAIATNVEVRVDAADCDPTADNPMGLEVPANPDQARKEYEDRMGKGDDDE